MQTENNVLKLEDYKKIKKKTKKKKYKANWKMYAALYKKESRCVQGWCKSKKEFLNDCVSMTKQLLDERRPEYFFDCFEVNKKELKKFDYNSVRNYALKKQKLKQKEKK